MHFIRMAHAPYALMRCCVRWLSLPPKYPVTEVKKHFDATFCLT